MKKPDDNQSYQELKNVLDEILAKLQHPDTDIDEAMKLHVQGQKTLKKLDEYLQKIADANEIDITQVN